jgi:hypothetical protein
VYFKCFQIIYVCFDEFCFSQKVNKKKRVEVTIFRVQNVGKIIMIDELEGGDCMVIIAIGELIVVVANCC